MTDSGKTPVDYAELMEALIRVGRLRPASRADWEHGLAVASLPGVTVELTLTMRQGQWEVGYRRSA